MRGVALSLIALLCVWAGGAGAQEVYRWVDSQGRTHYGDAPPPGVGARRVPGMERAREAQGRESGETTGEKEAGTAAAPGFGAHASLERRRLERRARELRGELTRVDKELERLAQLRERHHQVPADLRATLGDQLLSDEERKLIAHRREVEEALGGVQREFAALKADVERQGGGTPGWWRDLRSER